MKIFLLVILIYSSSICHGQEQTSSSEIDLDSVFNGNNGTFVLYNPRLSEYKIYNKERANTKFPVHSTSKIIWSIIGLEENLIPNEFEMTTWDSIKYPKKDWWPALWTHDLNVQTALNQSVNWYYIELLSKMTPETTDDYLMKYKYSDKLQVEKVHYFGLTMMIRKSAFEQIDFLKSYYNNELKISGKTYDLVKRALYFKTMDDAKIYFKTGLGPDSFDSGIGWVIGFIEKGPDIFYFALNVQNDDEWKAAKLRRECFEKLLPYILND